MLRLKDPGLERETKCKQIKTWFTSRLWGKVSICAIYLGLVNCGSCFSFWTLGLFSSSGSQLSCYFWEHGTLDHSCSLRSEVPLTYRSLNLPGTQYLAVCHLPMLPFHPPTHPPTHPPIQPASNKHLALLELLKLYRHILLSDKTSLEGKKSMCDIGLGRGQGLSFL